MCYQPLTRSVPEFRKKISGHIFHSQFSVFSSLWRRLAADFLSRASHAPISSLGEGRSGEPDRTALRQAASKIICFAYRSGTATCGDLWPTIPDRTALAVSRKNDRAVAKAGVGSPRMHESKPLSGSARLFAVKLASPLASLLNSRRLSLRTTAAEPQKVE